jgi:hypothetical protein
MRDKNSKKKLFFRSLGENEDGEFRRRFFPFVWSLSTARTHAQANNS